MTNRAGAEARLQSPQPRVQLQLDRFSFVVTSMEHLLFLLPSKPKPALVRYGVSALLVLISFAAEYVLWRMSGLSSFFLLFPAIAFCGLAFDRGSGVFAALLGTALAAWQIQDDLEKQLFSLFLFAACGVVLAVAAEALRKALERSWEARQNTQLLLDELNHRTKNTLAIVISLLRMQSRSRPEFGDALKSAANRVQVMADVHDFLRATPENRQVELGRYIEDLCIKVGDALRGVRPIAVTVQSVKIELPAEKAVPVGLVVNELVTNSLKYAFPDDREGRISVTIEREDELAITVEDNGIGCSDEPKGLGTSLVKLMGNQLGGTITRESEAGCRTILRFRP